MATAERISKPLTYEDFCALVKDGEKADLIDGVIHVASPDNTDANDINAWLGGLMFDFAEYFDLGRVLMSRVACKLDEHNAPEPDILFVRKANLRRILRGRVDGPANVAVEIVSHDSVERDYQKKWRQYERFKVDEYWIINEPEKTATFLRLGSHGKYREVPLQRGVFRSRAFPGFWLRFDWLWRDTRPLKVRALAALIRSVKKKRGSRNGKD